MTLQTPFSQFDWTLNYLSSNIYTYNFIPLTIISKHRDGVARLKPSWKKRTHVSGCMIHIMAPHTLATQEAMASAAMVFFQHLPYQFRLIWCYLNIHKPISTVFLAPIILMTICRNCISTGSPSIKCLSCCMVRYNAEFTWFGVVKFLVLKADDKSEQNIFSLILTHTHTYIYFIIVFDPLWGEPPITGWTNSQAMTLMCHHLILQLRKISAISAETDMSGDSFTTPAKHYWFRVFGASITYVIPVA